MFRRVIWALCLALTLFPASAQSPIAGFPPGTFQSRAALDASAGTSPATYTAVYGDSQAFGFGAGPYTSPSQTWGAGVAVVSVFSGNQNTDLTVTIKSVSATQIGGYSGTGHRCSLWQATVTSGSGTVVVNTAGVFDGVATAGGVVTTTTSTPSASQLNDMAVAAEPQNVVTVTVPASGAGVFFAGGTFGSSASLPYTWTNATRDSVTESFIGAGTSSSVTGGSSHTTTPGSTTPGVSTANGTFNFAGIAACMTAAAWSP